MKLFLFGIGGTGARVLRSLTMLLASGANVPADLTIIPILLDMDMQNGDTERALRLVELYRSIRQTAYERTGDQNTRRTFFFNTHSSAWHLAGRKCTGKNWRFGVAKTDRPSGDF